MSQWWNGARALLQRSPSRGYGMDLAADDTAQRVLPRLVHWTLSALLLVVGLAHVVTALGTRIWQPAGMVDQVVDLDTLEWGRAGTIALGILVLFVARALARGKRQAWLLSLLMLAISLVGGLHERSPRQSLLIMATLLILLVALAPFFSTRSDTWASVRGYIALALGGWVTWGHDFVRHLWRVGHLHLPRISTSLILVPLRFLAYGILAYGVWQLLRPVLSAHQCARDERERAAEVVRHYGCLSTAHFALGYDKSYFWSKSRRSLIAYRVTWGVALALADPIGPAEERDELLTAFFAFCRTQDWTVALYQVSPAVRSFGKQRGLFGLKIGEDAIVELDTFTLQGKIGAPVRHAVARAKRGGVTIRLFHGEPLPASIVSEMKRVSTAWLSKQAAKTQFGFSMGRFPMDWSPSLLTAVALGSDGRVQAFVTWTPLYAGNGWALDNIRRGLYAEPGAMELLLAESMSWAKEQGYRRMSLGLVPLAGLCSSAPDGQTPDSATTQLLERSADYLHRRGLLLGNYRSLHAFKGKFQPAWEARYLVTREGRSMPQILSALAFAMGMGWRGLARDIWDNLLAAWPRRVAARTPSA